VVVVVVVVVDVTEGEEQDDDDDEKEEVVEVMVWMSGCVWPVGGCGHGVVTALALDVVV
jgi:hypothetical protein